MTTYMVTVKRQGATIGQVLTAGQSASEAINTLDIYRPSKSRPFASEDTKGHVIINTADWHGFCFEARRVN